ncbi:hypothetical protein AC578_6218 [Pseudocercospora eumusae]|uniref:Endosomal/vacuolar adapter protein YPT35 n=1 Tax=Pseudocercospora eumusae TaxID=321146 RepID=A0A139H328_9PEZI|nr:hypothetical protein AC578_6218 [Pseudocercospora eumusae]
MGPPESAPNGELRTVDVATADEHVHAANKEPESDHVTDAPPFWWSSKARHSRSTSTVTTQARPAAIILEDHSEEDHEQTQACWARSVTIGDYTVVTGPSGMGAYVVWPVDVQTLKGGTLSIRKRYSEFDRLRSNLVKAFPHAEAMLPELPRKSVVSRFRPRFLEQRRNGLEHFLNCVLLNPEFASSPVLKDFIFA